ncbi:MAG TPA: MBL fold metallo-hydrolase [Candidatus Hydrogenedens sp.]|nr:MBL fold metallo-hydrolase [Candidatus Hydrogenedens sp.]HOL19032.1 MBL fold metallo-hydrolase [Candidatus Hydrogenedens sp.]HPP57786.1 MBL fold metallo-hydrolase [Candidatus Hydrogenedens sp.]
MKITSYGAAEEVTGSKHLLEIDGTKILLDCGLFQGRRMEADQKNRQNSLDINKINCIVLSHAHIDHSGLLPYFGKKNYKGPIYSTPATRDLCSIMLMDSAHIQQKDAQWLSKKNMTFIPPLYSSDDVHEIMRRFVSIPYEMRLQIANDIFLTFHDAGHVLGSAMVELEYREFGKWKRLIFSGDIGRKNMPILADPWEPKPCDTLIMESTYGDRDHGNMEQMDAKLEEIIKETVHQGGKIIVPSFALERTQEFIYALHRLETQNRIPDIPVFVDSPLAVDITEVFRLHMESFDEDFKQQLRNAGNPFDLKRIRYIRSQTESMELNTLKGPAIIISASGMCEYGRILHHLRNNISDPKNTILIIGFQAEYTLGRKIVEKEPRVRILGVMVELKAQVKIMNEFSAHAGRSELIDFGAHYANTDTNIFLVHGEPKAIQALYSALKEKGVNNLSILKYRQPVDI